MRLGKLCSAKNFQLTKTDELGNVTRWSYNRWGQMLSETDPLGNATSYSYDGWGNIISTENAAGEIAKFNYDHQGNLLSFTDIANQISEFKYDAYGNVTSVEEPSGNKATYSYDDNGNMLSETLTIDSLDGDPEELITNWTYNKEGEIESIGELESAIEYEYNQNGDRIAGENLGYRTEYHYNNKGQLVQRLQVDDTPDNNLDNPRAIAVYDRGERRRLTINPDGEVVHYKYDAMGRLTETIYDRQPNSVERLIEAIAPDATPASIDWTKVVYPDETPDYLEESPRNIVEYYKTGKVKARIDELGNRIEYEYDPAGRVALTRLDEDTYFTYTYDAVGNQLTETRVVSGLSETATYDTLGRTIAATNSNGETTRFEYNSQNQLTAVVNALLQRTDYDYDEAGNLTGVEDALGQVTTYEYNDTLGRITAVERADEKRTTFVYNDAENAIAVTDFNNDTIEYKHDELGRLTSKELLDTGETSVTFTYTDTGYSIADDLGITTYEYNEQGQLIARTDPTGPYLESGATIEYEYERGQVVSVKTPAGTTTYTYDEFGRLKTVTDSNENEVAYFYDEAGRLAKTEFPNDIVEIREYNDLNRLEFLKTVRIEPLSGEEIEVISSYDYQLGNAGNRRSVLENNGRQIEYKYDELNRLIEEVIGDRVITYSYDAVGNRFQKTDSEVGDTTYTYNNLNQLTRSITNGITTIYNYDDNGNLIFEETGENSITYDWVNDGENRLVGVTISDGDETTDIDYQYNYRGVRVGQVVDGVETRFLIDDLQTYAQVLEEYDATGNLQAAYVYGHDLISQQQGTQQFFYHVDGLGSTRALTDASGQVLDTYAYDAYGNLLSHFGDSNNAYLFAGEQRDSQTDLDYLRARYYDPNIGRFISADAYDGNLSDPLTLHDYQYAHLNPVMNTDPSGYLTLGEKAAGIALLGILAGISFTTGTAIANLASGGSASDAMSLYDQLLAGFGDALTFGGSTFVREWLYGETTTRDHSGPFFNLGRVVGGASGFGLGFGTPSLLEGIGWAGRVAQGYEVIGTFIGSFQSTRNILEGRATLFDILPFLPAIGYVLAKASAAGRRVGVSFLPDSDVISIDPSETYPVVKQAENLPHCGPEACRMALMTFESYGYPVTYTDLYSATTSEGTKLKALTDILKANGIPSIRYESFARVDELISAMKAQTPPPVIAIAEISTTSMSEAGKAHAVVVDLVTTARISGEDWQVFQIRDPGDGSIFLYPTDAFQAIFNGAPAIFLAGGTTSSKTVDKLNKLLGL